MAAILSWPECVNRYLKKNCIDRLDQVSLQSIRDLAFFWNCKNIPLWRIKLSELQGPFSISYHEASNLASHLASSSIPSNLWSFLSLIHLDPSHLAYFGMHPIVLLAMHCWRRHASASTLSQVTLYTAGHLHTAVPHCSHSRAPIVHTAVPQENNEHGCVYLRCTAVCKLPGCVEGHPWLWWHHWMQHHSKPQTSFIAYDGVWASGIKHIPVIYQWREGWLPFGYIL